MSQELKREKRICSFCEKEFECNDNSRKKYCDFRCRTRYNSSKRYHILKNDPKYKADRKKYYQGWHELNREKHNAYMAIKQREKWSKIKAERSVTSKTDKAEKNLNTEGNS